MSVTLQAIEDGSTRSDDDDRHDNVLVLAARQDLTAFGPLYRRYADRVYRYCLRRLDEPDRAEADGTALVIHETVEDLVTDPSGNSGARIACAVFFPPR